MHELNTADRTADLRGVRAVVTGASDGIGLALACRLAMAGAELVLAVRNREKGERAVARIRRSVPAARVELRDVDLASLASVGSLVRGLVAEARPIQLFVGNAGVILLRSKERQETADGFELHFQTNFLGHFALVAGLFPLLQAGRARVVLQSSLAAARYRIDWDDLQVHDRYTALRAYGRSKVALSLFGMELHRRSTSYGWGLTSVLSHPGTAVTAIAAPVVAPVAGAAPMENRMHALIARLGVIQSADAACEPALYAATAAGDLGGRFFGPAHLLHTRGRAVPLKPYARIADEAAAWRLWSVSEQLTGVRIP